MNPKAQANIEHSTWKFWSNFLSYPISFGFTLIAGIPLSF